MTTSAGTRTRWSASGRPQAATGTSGRLAATSARPLTNDAYYCGRLFKDRSGQPVLLAFHYYDQSRQFRGELADPMPVRWENGELRVTTATKA